VTLLCFADEELAFWLLIHLVENILGGAFYEKSSKGNALSGYLCERHIILKLATWEFTLSKEEQQELEMFLGMYGAQMLITAFVNFLSFQALCHIWTLMFESNSVDIITTKGLPRSCLAA
jgi:hypothetical protein